MHVKHEIPQIAVPTLQRKFLCWQNQTHKYEGVEVIYEAFLQQYSLAMAKLAFVCENSFKIGLL